MPSVALTGKDTIQVAGRNLRDFADGDVGKLTFDNDIVGMKTGKNGNTIANGNTMGGQGKLELRLLRGSADDSALSQLLTSQLADLPSFPAMEGYFVKRIGDGAGGVQNDTYLGQFGLFTKIPDAAENVEGATDPAVVIHRITFGNVKRATM